MGKHSKTHQDVGAMTQAVAVAMRKVRPLSQPVGSSILYVYQGGMDEGWG